MGSTSPFEGSGSSIIEPQPSRTHNPADGLQDGEPAGDECPESPVPNATFPIKTAAPALHRSIHPAVLVQTILFATAVVVARLAAIRTGVNALRRKRSAGLDLL
jgi:hypothetical protein